MGRVGIVSCDQRNEHSRGNERILYFFSPVITRFQTIRPIPNRDAAKVEISRQELRYAFVLTTVGQKNQLTLARVLEFSFVMQTTIATEFCPPFDLAEQVASVLSQGAVSAGSHSFIKCRAVRVPRER